MRDPFGGVRHNCIGLGAFAVMTAIACVLNACSNSSAPAPLATSAIVRLADGTAVVIGDRCTPYFADQVIALVRPGKLYEIENWASAYDIMVIPLATPDASDLNPIVLKVPVGTAFDVAERLRNRPGVVGAEAGSLGGFPESASLVTCESGG